MILAVLQYQMVLNLKNSQRLAHFFNGNFKFLLKLFVHFDGLGKAFVKHDDSDIDPFKYYLPWNIAEAPTNLADKH